MTTMFRKATLALALGASALTAAAPAQAQRYGGYRHNDNTGTAIVAGIAGLAIGAALVASSNNHRDRYRDDRYVDNRYPQNGYYRNDGYRADVRGYDDRRDYGQYDGRYDGGRGYNDDRRGGYDRGCHVESRWDRYSNRQVAVRVCN